MIHLASSLRLHLLVLLLLFSSGCASIVSKSVYPVRVTSEPSGATFTIFDALGEPVHRGTTPETVDLKAGRGFFLKANYEVTYSKAGCDDVTMPIRQGVDAWYVFGNFLVGGLIGWVIVDPLTGAMWTVKDAHGSLGPQGAVSADQ